MRVWWYAADLPELPPGLMGHPSRRHYATVAVVVISIYAEAERRAAHSV
jgi:hypothetical protein